LSSGTATPPEPVDPRDAFDQLGRLVLQNESMESVLQRVAELAKQVMPQIAEASVSLVGDSSQATVACTGQLAMDLDESQYEPGHGPCLESARGGEVIQIDDVRAEERWPLYVTMALELGVMSSLSTPIPVQRQAHAALNLYALKPNAFDPESVEMAATFASYAGVAIANMHLYDGSRRLVEQLQVAMVSRAVIDQAKGILMAQRHCSAQEAFEVLVDLSSRSNTKLRDVAQALVDQAVRATQSR
jgi:GAF domain-containing protein